MWLSSLSLRTFPPILRPLPNPTGSSLALWFRTTPSFVLGGCQLLRVPESASLAPPTPRGLVSRWLLGTLICAPPNGNGEKRVRGREVATTAAPPSDLSEINTSEPGKPGSHTRAKCETQLREPPNGNGVGCQVGSDGANSSSFS